MAPAGWTFKGAICDGRDVSTMPLALEGADVSGVDIVFTDRAIALSGTVTGASGADADATVLLFPTDSQRWTDNGPDPRQMKTARATATGTFTFSNVPEGDYFVTAVPDIVAGDWPDPALLQSLRGRATRITLNDGDTKTLHLQTIK
jgi:hypothetical protein